MIRQAGPDQAQQIVKPDLDLNCLTLVIFLKAMILKQPADDRNILESPSRQRPNVGSDLDIDR